MISGNMVGSYSQMGKTLILLDENGNEITGVIVDQETIFTAGDNDVREGMVYASDNGVSTGTKTIPSYHTRSGHKIVLANTDITISVPEYNYEELLVTISTYDTSWDKSVVSTYISVDNCMYMVGSNIKISDITIDTTNEMINLGLTAPEKSVVRYLVTREEF